jgi:hypothetical protein
MLWAMRSFRRNRYDALQPRDEPTWLTVFSMAGEVLSSQRLDPLTDLRRVLDVELERRLADGWLVSEPHSSTCATFFAERDSGERVGIAIVHVEPGTREPPR